MQFKCMVFSVWLLSGASMTPNFRHCKWIFIALSIGKPACSTCPSPKVPICSSPLEFFPSYGACSQWQEWPREIPLTWIRNCLVWSRTLKIASLQFAVAFAAIQNQVVHWKSFSSSHGECSPLNLSQSWHSFWHLCFWINGEGSKWLPVYKV